MRERWVIRINDFGLPQETHGELSRDKNFSNLSSGAELNYGHKNMRK
jgi:hypothetical protein